MVIEYILFSKLYLRIDPMFFQGRATQRFLINFFNFIKIFIFFQLVFSAQAQAPSGLFSLPPKGSEESILLTPQESSLRDQLLGNILKSRLELMHFSHKKIDDDLSQKAFKLFIERIDHEKMFLLETDVKNLKKYEKEMDDQLVSGNFQLMRESSELFKERVKLIDGWIGDILAKPFDLTLKETLESDVDKRLYPKDLSELKEIWRKKLKYTVMLRVSMLMEEQKLQKELIEKEKAEKKNKKGPKNKLMSAVKPQTAKEKKELKDLEKAKIEAQKVLKMTLKDMEKESREKVLESYQRLIRRLKDQDHDEQLDQFFNAISMVYDPHTSYLPPQKKEDFDIEMSGTLEGIGAILREDGEYIKVVKIIPGSASWKQKELEAEDTILKVAQDEKSPVDIVRMRINDAVKLIRGKRGTTVKLTVKKPSGIIKVIPIKRDIVAIEESYAKGALLQLDTKEFSGIKFGYIHVPKFYRDFEAINEGRSGRNCTTDVQNELDKFVRSGVKGVVLDLRENGGGALEDAKLMSGLFLKNGPIVQVKQSDGHQDILEDTDKNISFNGHLVVLLNNFSASASEILAAALQDYGRAIIVGGEQTHGKGTVQVFLNLDKGLSHIADKFVPLGAMKVTIQKFYRVTGGSTQYRGVVPDIILPDPYEYLETGEKHLDFSLPWDEVGPLKFTKWTETKVPVAQVRTKSLKRIEKNPHFQNINLKINLMKERKDKTILNLNLEESRQEQNRLKEELDKLEQEKLIENLSVSLYVSKKKNWEKKAPPIIIDSKDPGKKLKDYKNADSQSSSLEEEREEDDWAKNLYKDPYIEESLYILKDLIDANNG
jgi:carboxyl-terminal processing protease